MPPLKKSKKIKKDSKERKKNKLKLVSLPPTPTGSKGSSSEVPSDEAEAFKFFFWVSKKTFECISSLVREYLISGPPSGLINIEGRLLSVEKQVVALRRLASGESRVSVGASFGVGQSTVSQVTWRFIEAMEGRAKHHLNLPDTSQLERIKSEFEASFGLPNCCSAIDATHIIMTLPAVQTGDDWCDQESNYSIFLQGIVDNEMGFIDIVTGWPGGMSISRLLNCSAFYKLCKAGQRLNDNVRVSSEEAEIREYIVRGVAYPLLPWLITPHGANDLSRPVLYFNEMHETARLLAVNAFYQLKGSWRMLSKVM